LNFLLLFNIIKKKINKVKIYFLNLKPQANCMIITGQLFIQLLGFCSSEISTDSC